MLRQVAISCRDRPRWRCRPRRARAPTTAARCASRSRATPGSAPAAWRGGWSSTASPRTGPDGTPLPALALEWKSETTITAGSSGCAPASTSTTASPLTSVNRGRVAQHRLHCGCPGPPSTLSAPRSSSPATRPCPTCPRCWPETSTASPSPSPKRRTPAGSIGTGPFSSPASPTACYPRRQRQLLAGPAIPRCDRDSLHRAIRDQWLDLAVGRADLVEVPAEQLRQAREQRLTVVASPPVTLLALQVADSGVLGNPNLRAAIALAIDRGALSNVIFQKQGEVTASLLPNALTGYSFLFPTARDLNKAHELRGGLAPPPLTLAVEGDGAMQLAAQRIALNLREAGFNVQMVGAVYGSIPTSFCASFRSKPHSQRPALESCSQAAGQATPIDDRASLLFSKWNMRFLVATR